VSLIGGALGDDGQNYKNIIMAMNAAFSSTSGKTKYYEVVGTYFNSCPAPAATTREVLV